MNVIKIVDGVSFTRLDNISDRCGSCVALSNHMLCLQLSECGDTRAIWVPTAEKTAETAPAARPRKPAPPARPAVSPSGGTKHDADKPRMDLLDPLWLAEVAKVLGFGAKKYAAHNWRGGIQQSRLIAAALRHLLAHNYGEDTDPESGLPHLAHASCCLMFLTNMAATRPDMDDRYKKEPV